MTIEDGEYDIDISAFLERQEVSEHGNSLGIRYGFIPDSMDQTSPLTLYQTEQESLIQAKTIGTSGDSSIIFEGNPQRLASSKSPANEPYFLAFSPHDNKQVVLKKLNSTIRVSKSRNVAKWEQKIELWNKENENRQNRNILVPKIDARNKQTDKTRQTKASKRPPTDDSRIKINAVITDSDEESGFIDDNTINDSEFPDIHFDNTSAPKETAVTKTTSTPQITADYTSKILTKPELKPVPEKQNSGLKPGPKPKTNARSSSKRIPQASSEPSPKNIPTRKTQNSDSDVDIDDDFKDLEDQLREVLEEDGNQVANKSQNIDIGDEDDDESDADDYDYSAQGPIKINFEERNSNSDETPSLVKSFSGNSQNKPMSLKDLVDGRKKFDDDPSSEEE